MNSFISFALLAVTMAAVYAVSDKLVVAYQTAIARKRAHVKFLEDRIQAERKSLDEFVASLPENKTK